MAAMMAGQPLVEVEAVAPDPLPTRTLTMVPPAATDEAEEVAVGQQHETEFRSFGLAIVLGILIGIPALGALVAGGVWLAAPDTDPWAILGIALWVSLFCGPFLAGTVTVGLWSSRQH